MKRAVALFLVACTTASVAPAQTDIQWNTGAGSWNLAANWLPANIPDTPSERAIISLAGSYSVTVSSPVALGQLWISNPTAVVAIANGSNLEVDGPQFTAEGNILVNPTAGTSPSFLRIGNALTLDGNGVLILNANAANLDTAYLISIAQAVLTQGSGHRITGTGSIYLPLTNNGIVQADVPGRTMRVLNSVTNNGALRGTNTGTLDLSAVNIAQSPAGLIEADGGTVRLLGTVVSNGTIRTTGGGSVQVAGNAGFTSVTFDGPLQVLNGNVLGVAGSGLSHTGTVTLNPSAGTSGASIRFDATGSLDGAGEVVLNANAGNLDTAAIQRSSSAVYTNASPHTIRGTGRLSGSLINNGVINADQNAKVLEILATPCSNNNLITATSGSTLLLSNLTLNQAGNGQIVADSSLVRLNAVVLSGGTLSATGTGAFDVLSSSTFNNVSFAGPLSIQNGQTLTVTGAGLAHTGTVTVNPSAGGSVTLIRFGATGSLIGPGEVILNASAANLDTASIQRSASAVYTNSANHVIRGTGRLSGVLTNNGTINADQNAKRLEILANPTNNNNLITATNGATLDLTNLTLNQSPAARVVIDNALARLTGVNTNGVLQASGTGSFQLLTTCTFANVNLTGDLSLASGQTLVIQGAGLTHSGTLTVNPTAGAGATLLRFDASGVLDGPGEIVLNANPGNLDSASINRLFGAVYTNTAAHTIRGSGRLYGGLINNGLISADVAGAGLGILASPTTNNSTIQAVNSSTLDFTSVTLEQIGGGRVHAEAGSTVRFSACFINMGHLEATGGSQFQVLTSTTFNGVDLSGPLSLANGQTLAIEGNGLVHSGVMTINSTAGGFFTILRFDSSGPLGGDGTVLLNASPDNLDTAYLQSVGLAVCTNTSTHTIAGRGRLYGNFVNEGRLSPGSPGGGIGLLERIGDYAPAASAIHDIDVAGTTAGVTYDRIACQGAVTLAGTLNVSFPSGFVPAGGSSYDLLTGQSITGVFDTVNLPALPPGRGTPSLQYSPTAVTLHIPLCRADWNGRDGINSQDFFDFLGDFFAGNADYNSDGVTNSQDFFDFLTGFFGGCG